MIDECVTVRVLRELGFPVVAASAAALRERLHAIARVHGIDADIVRAVATDDALAFACAWPMDDVALTRWLNIVGTRELYRRGLLKHGWAIPSAAHVQGTAV